MNPKKKSFFAAYPGVFPGAPLVPSFVLSQDAPVLRELLEKPIATHRQNPAHHGMKSVRRLVPQSL